MLILYFENANFWHHHGLVGSNHYCLWSAGRVWVGNYLKGQIRS